MGLLEPSISVLDNLTFFYNGDGIRPPSVLDNYSELTEERHFQLSTTIFIAGVFEFEIISIRLYKMETILVFDYQHIEYIEYPGGSGCLGTIIWYEIVGACFGTFKLQENGLYLPGLSKCEENQTC